MATFEIDGTVSVEKIGYFHNSIPIEHIIHFKPEGYESFSVLIVSLYQTFCMKNCLLNIDDLYFESGSYFCLDL